MEMRTAVLEKEAYSEEVRKCSTYMRASTLLIPSAHTYIPSPSGAEGWCGTPPHVHIETSLY